MENSIRSDFQQKFYTVIRTRIAIRIKMWKIVEEITYTVKKDEKSLAEMLMYEWKLMIEKQLSVSPLRF